MTTEDACSDAGGLVTPVVLGKVIVVVDGRVSFGEVRLSGIA